MLIDTVRSTVPDLYLEYLSEVVMNGYVGGAELSKSAFPNEHVRRNAIPWNRRSFIEQGMLEVPEALAGEVTITQVCNSWWWHVEIKIDKVVIIQAVAPDIDGKIHSSSHKAQLARDNQKLLFPETEEHPGGSDFLFAALTHGPCQGDPSRPEFVAIQIPKTGEDGKIVGYYTGRIDLMEEFPHVFTPIIPPNPEETIEDAAFPEPLDQEQTDEEEQTGG